MLIQSASLSLLYTKVLRPKEKPKPKGYIEEVAEAPTIDVTANQINNVLEMKDKPAEREHPV